MPDRSKPLLPPDLAAAIPSLYATEHEDDPVGHAKFFTPWSNWTWYVTEFDGQDLCFGLVVGMETELGYFSLAEIGGVRSPYGLCVERDEHFTPQPLSKIRGAHGQQPAPEGPDAVSERRRTFTKAVASDEPKKPYGLAEIPSPFERPGVELIDTRLDRVTAAPQHPNVSSPRAGRAHHVRAHRGG